MNHLSLFTGAGGGELAFQHLLKGFKTIGYVEYEDYPQRIIRQRIKDGLMHNAPIYSDIRTFIDSGCAKLYRGITDVISGGFPCQDISCAGHQKGLSGERSGLWNEMATVVRKVKPRYVFVENSPMLTIRGLGTVLRDLAEMGYNAKWGCISSENTKAMHRRKRIWIVADMPEKHGCNVPGGANKKFRNMGKDWTIRSFLDWYMEELEKEGAEWEAQRESDLPPYLCRISNALAPELDELKAIGNGQDPIVAATAWNILTEGLTLKEK